MASQNLAHLLVGSEGTLAWSRRLKLQLSPLPAPRVLGVVNFPDLPAAMASAQHIVRLGPTAVELVDRTMIELSRANPAFRPTIDAALIGEPDAMLLVEFAGDRHAEQLDRLRQLVELMADLGLPGSVVELTDDSRQKALWEVRKAGLNIMMSLKRRRQAGVASSRTARCRSSTWPSTPTALTEVFRQPRHARHLVCARLGRHAARAPDPRHAPHGPKACREDARDRRGGRRDGARVQGRLLAASTATGSCAASGSPGSSGRGSTRASRTSSSLFDPDNLMNPGKIVRPAKMDDAALFRFRAGLRGRAARDRARLVGLERAERSAVHRGRPAAPGSRRRPRRRVRQGRRDVQQQRPLPQVRRGHDVPELSRHARRAAPHARARQHAAAGAVGPARPRRAGLGDVVRDAMELCVSCKGCRRECPTGVDMARMKIELPAPRTGRHGLSLQRPADRAPAALCAVATRLAALLNLRDRVPALARLTERWLGLSAPALAAGLAPRRVLRTRRRRDRAGPRRAAAEVVLFADTFNRDFEPENARAALRVLQAAGYAVHVPRRRRCRGDGRCAAGARSWPPAWSTRPAPSAARWSRRCCPLRRARRADRRAGAVLPADAARRVRWRCAWAPRADTSGGQALLFEEFLAREHAAGRLALPLRRAAAGRALVHGHCHQKAFGAFTPVPTCCGWSRDSRSMPIESSCCGMAGSFGYDAGPPTTCRWQMGELSLLPAVRAADADTLIVADGTSCRHQIDDGAAATRCMSRACWPTRCSRRGHPDGAPGAGRPDRGAVAPQADARGRSLTQRGARDQGPMGGHRAGERLAADRHTEPRKAVDRSRVARLTACSRSPGPRSLNTPCCRSRTRPAIWHGGQRLEQLDALLGDRVVPGHADHVVHRGQVQRRDRDSRQDPRAS